MMPLSKAKQREYMRKYQRQERKDPQVRKEYNRSQKLLMREKRRK